MSEKCKLCDTGKLSTIGERVIGACCSCAKKALMEQAKLRTERENCFVMLNNADLDITGGCSLATQIEKILSQLQARDAEIEIQKSYRTIAESKRTQFQTQALEYQTGQTLKICKLQDENKQLKEKLRWIPVSVLPEVTQRLASPMPKESDLFLLTDGETIIDGAYISTGSWVTRGLPIEFVFKATQYKVRILPESEAVK